VVANNLAVSSKRDECTPAQDCQAVEATAVAILRLLRNTDDFPNELHEVA